MRDAYALTLVNPEAEDVGARVVADGMKVVATERSRQDRSLR
jgi:hypothetical protein